MKVCSTCNKEVSDDFVEFHCGEKIKIPAKYLEYIKKKKGK